MSKFEKNAKTFEDVLRELGINSTAEVNDIINRLKCSSPESPLSPEYKNLLINVLEYDVSLDRHKWTLEQGMIINIYDHII